MDKRICFLYTETNGLHKTNDEITKKNLFSFARLVVLNYEIGVVTNDEYIQEKKVKFIIKPRCMIIPDETVEYHGITQDKANAKGKDPEEVLNIFKTDLKNVDILVSHSVDFHLKTVLAESLKYNISIDFNKIIIIDTISFYHSFGFIKLKDLALKLKIKDIPENNKNNVELIKNIFFKLYSKFKKSLV
jgi:DNA polymerase III epsilon subunit-like protein